MKSELTSNDALIVVDMQNDFCPGGALPVRDCDTVVASLNRWIARASHSGAKVIASRDWHPPGHTSFQEQGGKWPPHCVRDTEGAQFRPDLNLPSQAVIVSKGVEVDRDAYSAFQETGLANELQRRGITRVWIGGVALDVCVRATALDAHEAGFEVHVIRDATSPVDEEQGRKTLEELEKAGVVIESETAV